MYRDDSEALLARADALQVEVDQLRAELAKARAEYVPASITPPKPPPVPKASRREAPLPPPPAELVHRVSEQLDRIPDAPTPPPKPSITLQTIMKRLLALSPGQLEELSEIIERMTWYGR